MLNQKVIGLLAGIIVTSSYAAEGTSLHHPDNLNLQLHQLPGLFRFSFDNLSMPNDAESMGLLGVNYFGDVTPYIYGGMGGYGSVLGSQGGLFVLGAEGGLHHEFASHWWGDAGLFVGGGGGKSSLVGGGLMVRPHIGITYDWQWARLGLHYSYINFPSGKIHSQQVGLDLDIPTDFYYLYPQQVKFTLYNLTDFQLPCGKYLDFQRNEFAILLQAYRQRHGTKNTDDQVQDGTIGLVGFEFDHYFIDHTFWWLKASGAFSGIPHGYMDALAGLGYHWSLGSYGIALVSQLGVGAGGGGQVETGGGLLVNPQIGIESPAISGFSARVSSGYIWATKGDFRAVPITGELLYHLDVATGSDVPKNYFASRYSIQGWRIQLLNQTYFHPQRSGRSKNSSINLVAVQIDQLFTPLFFLSYQGAFAYRGDHAGGFATGMIGPGIQSPELFNRHIQLFSEVLIGAGGGGGLALGGGSLIEPLAGVRYVWTPRVGLQASVSEIKALRDDLRTPALSVGLTISFDTLNRV